MSRPHLFSSGEPQNYTLFYDEMISRLMKWQRGCRTPALPGEAPR